MRRFCGDHTERLHWPKRKPNGITRAEREASTRCESMWARMKTEQHYIRYGTKQMSNILEQNVSTNIEISKNGNAKNIKKLTGSIVYKNVI